MGDGGARRRLRRLEASLWTGRAAHLIGGSLDFAEALARYSLRRLRSRRSRSPNGRRAPSPARAGGLRYVDPRRPRGALYRAFVLILSSRPMTALSRTRVWGMTWRIDPILLPMTRGRLGTGLLLPTALLQTVGARSGRVRRNAVIYFHDGERVTIVASKAGHPGNPAWYHNARANPHVLLGGVPFRAEVVEDEAERARLWELADRVFPAFARYRETAGRAGRTIPIVQLVPR